MVAKVAPVVMAVAAVAAGTVAAVVVITAVAAVAAGTVAAVIISGSSCAEENPTAEEPCARGIALAQMATTFPQHGEDISSFFFPRLPFRFISIANL